MAAKRDWISRGWLVPPVVAGVMLRLAHLRPQILAGDELHAPRAALQMPLSEIFATYQVADHCIPLTALYRFLMDRGVVLGELGFRLPILASGILLLIIAPLALEAKVGRAAATSLAWLLAIAPTLVLYSRIVRSYMPLVLLCFLAVVALEKWIDRPSWKGGAAYVAAAALAIYVHLAAVPFVCSQILFALGYGLAGPRANRPNLRSIFALSLGLGIAVGALLAPARTSLKAVATAVHTASSPDLGTLVGVLELQAGTARPIVVGLFFVVAAWGFVALTRREPRLTAHVSTIVIGQTTGLCFLSPLNFQYPLMFNRYLLPILPWVLIAVAVGLATPWWPRQRTAGAILQRTAAYGSILLFLAAGPLAESTFWSSPFMHHNDFFAFYRPRGRMPEGDIPAFYHRLQRGELIGPIVEHPFHASWKFSRHLRLYQEFHRQPVKVSSPELALFDPRIELRNLLRPTASDLVRSGARYVVVHLDSGAELGRIRELPGLPEADESLRQSVAEDLRAAATELANTLERAWGPPFSSDGVIQVWKLPVWKLP